MKRFEIKDYNFGELAQMYYPDREYSTAMRRFREELQQTTGLSTALKSMNYKGKERMLTRSQVRVIVQYLGDP